MVPSHAWTSWWLHCMAAPSGPLLGLDSSLANIQSMEQERKIYLFYNTHPSIMILAWRPPLMFSMCVRDTLVRNCFLTVLLRACMYNLQAGFVSIFPQIRSLLPTGQAHEFRRARQRTTTATPCPRHPHQATVLRLSQPPKGQRQRFLPHHHAEKRGMQPAPTPGHRWRGAARWRCPPTKLSA